MGLERTADARAVLSESVRAFPCNWSAWLDLLKLCADAKQLPPTLPYDDVRAFCFQSEVFAYSSVSGVFSQTLMR